MNQAKIVLPLFLAIGVPASFAQWVLDPLFTLAPGSRSYLQTTGDNQRGLGYNSVTGHLLLADHNGGSSIHILDGLNGNDLGTMNTTGISGGGTFALNTLKVADDGAIYAASLSTDTLLTGSGQGFIKIYRWANEGAVPTVAYNGDPSASDGTATNRRFGDTLDVRGAGTATQILMASRNGQILSVFTTGNGTDFSANKISTTVSAGDLGLGLSFGAGDTIWGTAVGRPIREVAFSIASNTGTIVRTIASTEIPTTHGPLGFDTDRSVIVAVNLMTTPTKDNLVLYNVGVNPSLLRDTRTFPNDQANANGAGVVEFAGDKVYALDVNNGIMAFNVVPEPGTVALGVLGLAFLTVRRRRA